MKRIRNLIPVTLWLTVLLAVVSCGRQGAVREKLDVAESLMNARPDSALAVLQGIPASAVKRKKASARYALLSSMALDKNYIDTTTFDILQPAIDYYTQHGTPDEQLRTYYYQGRIYQNQGDDDSAMRSFMKGCDLGKRVTDSLLLAHTLWHKARCISNSTRQTNLFKTTGRLRLCMLPSAKTCLPSRAGRTPWTVV